MLRNKPTFTLTITLTITQMEIYKMAKANTTDTANAAFEEMLALLSPEERETLAKLTGQDQGGSGTRTPVVKINYREKTAQDGTKIAKGNFCVGQKNGTVDGKTVLLTAGTDLGTVLEAVILKKGQQFSFWNEDAKKRCSSQVICERNEVPVGYNLKSVCNDRSCARRKEGVDKADRCVSQYVVYLRMPAGTKLPDGTDCLIAMFYIKGTSYMPFQGYMDTELKSIPSIAVTTKFSTTEEEQGSTLFYVLGFEKGQPVPISVFKENFQLVGGINKQIIEYKGEQAKKMLEGTKAEGKSATEGTQRGVTVVNEDDQLAW